MNNYKNKITISLLLSTLLTSSLVANSDLSEVDALAKRVMELTQESNIEIKVTPKIDKIIKVAEVKEMQENPTLISQEESLSKKPTPKKSATKVTEVLQSLGELAVKEGTDSACKFCSAILKDVTVNKVEVVSMAQDWVELRIKKGDTLSSFAKHYYGDANAYKLISNFNHNHIKHNHIYRGNLITIPRIESLEEKHSKEKISCKFCKALLADNSLKNIDIVKMERDWIEVKVKRGDNLSNLARKYYGKASLYPIIYNANREKIAKNYTIYAGETLRIPNRES